LLRGKSVDWSHKARTLKFDLEYRPAEQERRRVAGELHDQVLPLLARLSRHVNSMHGESAKILSETIHQVIEKIRALLGELHPFDLEELGLKAATANLCTRYSRLYKQRILYEEGDEELLLSAVQELAAYRALQTLLRMFASKNSGTLTVTSVDGKSDYQILLVLRNGQQSAARTLISDLDEQDLEALAGWCNIAQMEVRLQAGRTPHSVVLSIAKEKICSAENTASAPTMVDDQSRARLTELESVVTAAQEEWTQMLNRDATVTGNMAVSVERQRLCRLVDELLYPDLEKINLLAEQLEEDSALFDSVDGIKQALDGVISAAYPHELQSLNLVELVGLSVERFKRATLIGTKIVAGKIETVPELTLEKKITVFRIFQEALHNVEKHAQASTLLVLIEPTSNAFVIYVEDNGMGMAAQDNGDGTHNRGMRGVRERAREIGATVSWQKSISYESGTLVTIKVPRS